jgi:hypothetical protein
MRRIGLTAAGLAITLVLALTLATSVLAKAPLTHTCSATDRQFILQAKTNVTALGLWAQEYLSGDAPPGEVVSEAKRAAAIVHSTEPTDFSLRQARNLMWAMFIEYGRAIQAHARHRDAGEHMYQAYNLANLAHQALTDGRPALGARGCDVASLL